VGGTITDINRRQSWLESNTPIEQHAVYRKVHRIVEKMEPGRVLEIGCNDGRYLEILRRRGWAVQGLDLQPQRLGYILEHDAAKPFPFAPEQFDLVLAVEVIEHLVDTDEFLRQCARVLRAGGVLIVTTPNLLFGPNRLLMLFGRRPLFTYVDFHVRMFVWSDLEERISRLFTIRSVKGSHVLLGVRRSRLFQVFSLLGDLLPRLSAHFIVTGLKRQ
jgi:SAM-dependent methyltransferase